MPETGWHDRPERGSDVRSHAGSYAEPEAPPPGENLRRHESGDAGDADIARITARVFAEISQHQHLHLPEQPPNADQLAELREKVPEVYELGIETTRKRNDHEIWQSQKALRQPYLLASLGQWLGLVAVLGFLVLAGYALHLGHGTVAGILV